jgi:hypothetical protein
MSYSGSFLRSWKFSSRTAVFWYWDCPAWQRRFSTCGRALLPHEDKHMFIYVLELCKSEAKRSALTEFKHINKHVFVRMGKKCTPASRSSTLPRRTRTKGRCFWSLLKREQLKFLLRRASTIPFTSQHLNQLPFLSDIRSCYRLQSLFSRCLKNAHLLF